MVCADIDANAVEEHIQSAEYVHRCRNCGVDGRASQTAALLDLDPGEWERVIAVNLTGMFHLAQQAAQQMVRQGVGGSIINVTSQLAEVARPERAAMSSRRAAAGR